MRSAPPSARLAIAAVTSCGGVCVSGGCSGALEGASTADSGPCRPGTRNGESMKLLGLYPRLFHDIGVLLYVRLDELREVFRTRADRLEVQARVALQHVG